MAKKRSKKDRLRTEMHRVTKTPSQASVPVKETYLEEIFAYDPKLIIKDLKKTFIVVVLILLVLLAIALLYT